MGNGAPVMINRGLARVLPTKGGQKRKSVRLGTDWLLVLTVVTLLTIGLLMVYSASWDYSLMVLGEAPTYMFMRQLMWLGIGAIIAFVLTFFNYHIWQKLAIPIMGLTIVSLIVVLLVNEVINNAARTLWGGSIQPSELAKLTIVIYLSVWMYAKREQLGDVSFGLIPLGAILGILGGLIFIQPDLSASATIFILGGMLFFLAGGDLRQIAFLMVLATLAGGLVFRLHPTGSSRVAEYLASLEDITQAPYHLSRSLEAIVKGSWFGVGIGRADTKLTGLPVPPTDSIFAVVSEETGIFGATILVLLYVILLWRGLKIAQHAPDGLGKLLAAGLSLWIGIEAVINMAVIVGLLPFAGNALPFISAGGSNLIVCLAAIGILLNISRQSVQAREKEERTFDAVIDLRRGDGRRRVSRPVRPPHAARRR